MGDGGSEINRVVAERVAQTDDGRGAQKRTDGIADHEPEQRHPVPSGGRVDQLVRDGQPWCEHQRTESPTSRQPVDPVGELDAPGMPTGDEVDRRAPVPTARPPAEHVQRHPAERRGCEGGDETGLARPSERTGGDHGRRGGTEELEQDRVGADQLWDQQHAGRRPYRLGDQATDAHGVHRPYPRPPPALGRAPRISWLGGCHDACRDFRASRASRRGGRERSHGVTHPLWSVDQA